MSVQFGRWNFAGQAVASDYIENVTATLAPYGPDSNESHSGRGVSMLYRAFHTTKDSHRETQPHICSSGVVITWDGRLDNRAELLGELRNAVSIDATDVAIVAAAYEKWGADCFAKVIGDWALSIWNPTSRSVLLAKDPIGTHHLFYSVERDYVTWSTVLEPLVRFAGKTFGLEEEYIAGWLAGYPTPQLTPYVGIHAVQPSCFVHIRPEKCTTSKYWDFNPKKTIRYRTDAEYEDHFRTSFATAVRRRLRCDCPLIAELSGGMDSSSIVCMADVIIARGEADTPRLDTISYYDDSDPILDERPYFTKVEQMRRRAGYHIDLGAKQQSEENQGGSKQFAFPGFESDGFSATPNSDRNLWPELFDDYAHCMNSHQYRVILSGTAGEDATGGYVPSPIPELQDLVARAQFSRLLHQLEAWSAKVGEPRLALLWKALRGFCTASIRFPSPAKYMCPPPWLQPGFVRRNEAALYWYPSKLKLFGALPSFQNCIHQLNHQRRFLGSRDPSPNLLVEMRYPYLDRDLLEFAYAIPREQMVGVGKRRYLMKRALVGIVPDEVLNRKRRAALTQKAQKEDLSQLCNWDDLRHPMITGSLGIVDPDSFFDALRKAHGREDFALEKVKSTLLLEFWLRHLSAWGIAMMTKTSAKKLPAYRREGTVSAHSSQKFS